MPSCWKTKVAYLIMNVDVTGVTLEQTDQGVSKLEPHHSVMFAASVVNSDYCTVEGNPFSVFNSDLSVDHPSSVSGNKTLEVGSELLEDSDEDLHFTFSNWLPLWRSLLITARKLKTLLTVNLQASMTMKVRVTHTQF